jgi:hypothetical protein
MTYVVAAFLIILCIIFMVYVATGRWARREDAEWDHRSEPIGPRSAPIGPRPPPPQGSGGNWEPPGATLEQALGREIERAEARDDRALDRIHARHTNMMADVEQTLKDMRQPRRIRIRDNDA